MTKKTSQASVATTLEAIATSSILPAAAFAALREHLLTSAGDDLSERVYEAVRSLVWSSVSNREIGNQLNEWADTILRLRQLLRSRSSYLAERFTVLADFLDQSNRFSKFHAPSEILERKHVRTILKTLLTHGANTSRATIAQTTKLRDANLSRVLANLASAGWIRRQNQGREVTISLTEEGSTQARALLPKDIIVRERGPFSDPASLSTIGELWERTDCAIAVSDHQRLVSCDRKFASIFGLDSPEVLVGMDVLALRNDMASRIGDPDDVVADEISLADGRTLRLVEIENENRSLWLGLDVTPYKRKLDEFRRRDKFLRNQIDDLRNSGRTNAAFLASNLAGDPHDDVYLPMLAAVRSDLLTPINSINSIAQVLMQGRIEGEDALIFGILDQSKKLRTVIRDIVNVSELFGAPYLTSEVEPIALLREVLGNLDYTTRQWGLSLVAPSAPAEIVETDARALRVVIFQALTGIAEMAPAGSKVNIETALEENTVVMRVFTDSFGAIGMPNQTLFLCQHTVHRFGGQFSFTSETGDGVSARVSWPVFRTNRVGTRYDLRHERTRKD